MKKVFLLSLGCPRNLVDSEVLRGLLSEKGFILTDAAEEAEIAVVNTCGFIGDAKEESIEYILRLSELKKEKKLSSLVVCGCLVQRYSDEIFDQIPEIDAFFGVDDFVKISDYLSDYLHDNISKVRHTEVGEDRTFLYDHKLPRELITPAHYAYVKIQEGCSQRCSFCAIPAIKGKSRSRLMDSVIKEVECLRNEHDVKEIVLIGQDTTRFGYDTIYRSGLSELLDKLTKEFPAVWFRLLYSHPENFTEELIGLFAERKNLLNYLDIPIQHINSRILKLMRRPVTADKIRDLVHDLRKVLPEVFLRTSVMCGFPTETDDEFNELLEFLKEVKFERLGAFKYSKEEGTDAADLDGQISEEIKEKRYASVMQLQQEISLKKNLGLVGKKIQVLIEERTDTFSFMGRSYMDAPEVDGVTFVRSGSELQPGSIVEVEIKGAMEYDLVGEVV